MSTNPIGAGTRNLSINVRVGFHRWIGRAAFVSGDIGIGEFVRRIIYRAKFFMSARNRARLAAAEDKQALTLLREALSDGLQQSDQPTIERAMRLIADSERNDEALVKGARA